jgi:hypothetical protein
MPAHERDRGINMTPFSKLLYSLTTSTVCLMAALPAASYAAVTEKDVKVVAKAIGFVEGGPKGAVDVAVVTDGGASKADADAFVALAGAITGDITLKPTIVAPGALASSNAKVAFIPAGLSGSYGDIAAASASKKIITVTTDPACVAAQKCAISIVSEPKVDITVSKAAASASGVAFGSAFSMMIKEVP